MGSKQLEIDGSYGEGGGQILRTALSLSCLLSRPFRIVNIRKNRRKPGLMPQHLMAVRASAEISGAKVRGDTAGSIELVFEPSGTRPGDYFFDIGTAGSTSLLLQAVLPPLVFSRGESSVVLKGGTHVPFSPPYEYISKIFIPALEKLGIRLECQIKRYGFYPKGGGEIRVRILPASAVKGVNLTERGKNKIVWGISAVANLPSGIAERQKSAALAHLSGIGVEGEIEVLRVPSFGKGTFIFLEAQAGTCAAGFSSLGEIGKKAEAVGEEAARELIDYFLTSACLDPHLADQILLYLAAAEGPGTFTTSRITQHLLTNIKIIEDFLGPACSVDGKTGKDGTVFVKGTGAYKRLTADLP
jgi:RNA 3'-terminal phosphate cyclase (ATP)